MKTALRILIVVIVFLIISLTVNVTVDSFFSNTIFTVSGIMFSLGLGLIVTFNMHGVKNPSYIDQIRTNINEVRTSFLVYFSITTICFLLDYYLRQNNSNVFCFQIGTVDIVLNASVFFCLIMLYSIVYFILNFLAIQKLNNDIFDRVIQHDS
jgi:hypothetical protein